MTSRACVSKTNYVFVFQSNRWGVNFLKCVSDRAIHSHPLLERYTDQPWAVLCRAVICDVIVYWQWAENIRHSGKSGLSSACASNVYQAHFFPWPHPLRAWVRGEVDCSSFTCSGHDWFMSAACWWNFWLWSVVGRNIELDSVAAHLFVRITHQ